MANRHCRLHLHLRHHLLHLLLVFLLLLLLLVQGNDNLACLETFPETNRAALTTHQDVDFLPRRGSKTEELQRRAHAKRLQQRAVEYVYANTRDVTVQQQQLAGLLPERTGCAFLRVKYIERAGLGHTISCWAHYLLLAQQLNLTYHSPFYSAAHHTCNLNETAYFFGFHPVYYWANEEYLDVEGNSNIKTINVGSTQFPCNVALLSTTVAAYRKQWGDFSCADGKRVVFVCDNEHEPFTKREQKSIISWIEPLRGILQASMLLLEQQQQKYIPLPLLEAIKQRSLIIVAHVRRGDILQSRKVDREHRLMSFAAYADILRQVVTAAARSSVSKSGISIFFLCEGAKDARHVAEYDQGIQPWGFPAGKRTMYQLDIGTALSSFCQGVNGTSPSSSSCSAMVLHDATFLQSFETMCLADVLILGTSGFSWPPAALCRPGLSIGRDQLFVDFKGYDNIIPLKPVAGGLLWRDDVSIELPNLDAKIKLLRSHPRIDTTILPPSSV